MSKLKEPYWRLDEKAYWPSFRADTRNTGRAPNWLDKRFNKKIKWPDKPWAFKLGKAITSAPVIGADGTIYVGSADTYFYAIKYDGTLKWKLKINHVIDDSAVIARRTDPNTGEEKDYVFFPGSDGFARKVDCKTGKVVGAFEAKNHYINPDGTPIFDKGVPKCNWFESDFTFSENGLLLAGCDDFAFYMLNPETMKCAVPEFMTKSMIWSGSPTGINGEFYFGSLDSIFRCIDKKGKLLWWYPIFGTAGCGPTILDNGNVIMGSGNNNVYCFEGKRKLMKLGKVKWKFHTKGDVWSSAALSYDGASLYFSSADGIVYAVNSGNGNLLWTFPTLRSNRCGPVLDPNGDVFIASGDGKIYKLSGKDGHRIWSFNCQKFNVSEKYGEYERHSFITTSIALSPGGVYAPNQNGNVYFVPFSYMESEDAKKDPRCCFNPNPDLPLNGIHLIRVSYGGRLFLEEIDINSKKTTNLIVQNTIGRSDLIVLQLIIMNNGKMLDARISDVNITSNIPFRKHVQISTDAHFINIIPMEFLKPGQEYNLKIKGKYIIPKKYGWFFLPLDRIWKGKKAEGTFETNLSFKVRKGEKIWSEESSVINIGNVESKIPGDILILKNLYIWQEALLANLTIIAMDCLYIILVPIYHDRDKQKIIFWAMQGEKITGIEDDLNPSLATYKIIKKHKSTPFRFPIDITYDLDGTFRGKTSGFNLDWAGVGMPMDMLLLTGKLDKNLELMSGSTAFFETSIKDIPNFGRILKAMNVVNNEGNFMATGTYRIEKAKGPIMKSLSIKAKIKNVECNKKEIKIYFEKEGRISLDDYFVSVVLINIKKAESIKQDYQSNISFIKDKNDLLEVIIQKLDENISSKIFYQDKCLLIILVDTVPFYKTIL
ncbi:MAG: outer membrane protein assembly factor BamB family protein [Promethearchaeota archaeon]